MGSRRSRIWAYLAPILVENGGWALFITTPLGNNHAKAMYDKARSDPAWFAEISTVADTDAISREAVEVQRKEYQVLFGETAGDALIEQEYYCSFSSVVPGAYYSREMTEAERDKRITQVDVDPNLPVHSAWDLGIDDSTAIWCFQINGPELRIVDYYEASGHGAEHYATRKNIAALIGCRMTRESANGAAGDPGLKRCECSAASLASSPIIH